MKKILTIIGARPQIIKSAAISRAVQTVFSDRVTEVLVHTGQHYSADLSTVFFQELGLREPDYNLAVGSGQHGSQTAEMIKGIEEVLEKEKPNAIVLYGDTNSTLAGALAASKMQTPVVHIEAGLRSYNKSMPEEINRIMCDHVSTLLFSPTKAGVANLQKEGFHLENKAPYSIDNPKVYHCGDIMYDNSLHYSKKMAAYLPPYELMSLQSESFFLGTVHRPANTDNPEKLRSIFRAFIALTNLFPSHTIYLPLHPRTRRAMNMTLDASFLQRIAENPRIKIIPPVSFMNMIALQQHCDLVITDSGGLQKEAYFFEKPSVILRPETEWIEIVAQGNAVLVDADKDKIIDATVELMKKETREYPPIFGDGKAAEFIVEEILKHC